MKTISDQIDVNGVPTNGVEINAYKAQRFSNAPAKGQPPPAGGPDAGPVLTSADFGNDGQFQLQVPTFEDYYLHWRIAGVDFWKFFDAAGFGPPGIPGPPGGAGPPGPPVTSMPVRAITGLGAGQLIVGTSGQPAAASTIPEASVANLAADLDAKAAKTRQVSAGTGLTGGGDLSADRTLTADFGTGAGNVTQGNDPRLSDQRIPADASVTDAKVAPAAAIAESKLNLRTDAPAGVGSRRTLGTGHVQAAAGDDARLSDQRVPPDGSVTSPKLADGAVTSAKILDGTIVDADVAPGAAIAESKIANLIADLYSLHGAIFNVKSPIYGAVGDAVADDTAAIQAAIDAAAAALQIGVVYVPTGVYKISTLLLPPGVFLVGTHKTRLFSSTAGSQFAVSGGNGVQPTGDGCGVFGISFTQIASAPYFIYAPNGVNGLQLRDVSFQGPSTACVYARGSCQFWDWDSVHLGGGQYGIYMPSNGLNTDFDAFHFRNLSFASQSILPVYIKLDIGAAGTGIWDAVSMAFMAPGPGQVGGCIKVDRAGNHVGQWTFIGFNSEFTAGQRAGMTAYTTCNGASGGNIVTLAAKVGVMPDGTPAWVNGQTITIGGVGPQGRDFRARITNVAGMVLTLDANLPSTATAAPITPYTGVDVDINGSATFINPNFGNSAGTLYGLDASAPTNTNGGTITIIGSGGDQASPRPIYDPNCRVLTHHNILPVRRTTGNPAPTDRYWLSQTYFESLAPGLASGEAIWPRRSQIATPAGGDLRLVLLDSAVNGTGTFGTLRVTKSDTADGTDVATVDPTGKGVFSGGLYAPGGTIDAARKPGAFRFDDGSDLIRTFGRWETATDTILISPAPGQDVAFGGDSAALATHRIVPAAQDSAYELLNYGSGSQKRWRIMAEGPTAGTVPNGLLFRNATDGVNALFLSNDGNLIAAGLGTFAQLKITDGVTVLASVDATGALTSAAGIGLWGHAKQASQPAAPVTLADVIAVIRGCGLSA